MPNIWIVDDDESVRQLVEHILKTIGINTFGLNNGDAFMEKMDSSATEPPDLVLLDTLLPETDSLSILKWLRGNIKFNELPVLLLMDKNSVFGKEKGLRAGANDCVLKPFGILEFIVRIFAILNKDGPFPVTGGILTCGDIQIDPNRRVVTSDGSIVELTFKEYELLHCLLANAGSVITRDKISDEVWQSKITNASRTVDMHVMSLRQKLGEAGRHIKTIRNVGYMLGE